MKITVHNLGVIKEAKIDLKPLTIFVGPNNNGKTWLAYTLVGIFGPYGFSKYIKEYLKSYEVGIPGVYPLLEKTVEQVLKNGSATIDLVRFIRESGETYFNKIAESTQSWMSHFMSTEIASFEKLKIAIDLEEMSTKIQERIVNFSLNTAVPRNQQEVLISLRKKRGEKELFIYISIDYPSSDASSPEEASLEEQTIVQLPPDIIKEIVISNILQGVHRTIYPQARILPTERTTFITFPFHGRKTRDGFIKERIVQEQKTKELISPVSLFLRMIQTSLEDDSGKEQNREKEAQKNPKIKKYIELARLLETQILSGDIRISQDDKATTQITQAEIDPAREILFQPTEDQQLEISIASSMVKELSPLVIYLRYLAKPNELIVIDEPEMNLHPEAQVKLIEFIAMLVNSGLNILITTHSPYLIDHLTNLIKATQVEDKESIRNEFYLKRTDAFLAKDKVSVYLFEHGHTTQAMDEDGVVQLNTFGEVSDRISEIYFKL